MQPDAPTTTARELANELASYAAALRETGEGLAAEIQKIKQSRAEIQTERDTYLKGFADNTLTELSGEKFDEMAELIQSTPDIVGQGLAYIRDQLIAAGVTLVKRCEHSLKTTQKFPWKRWMYQFW